MKIFNIIVFLAIFSIQLFAAEEIKTVYSDYYFMVDSAKGSSLDDSDDEIIYLIKTGKLEQANDKIKNKLNAYKNIFNPKLKQYSFISKEEFDAFDKNSTVPFEWIDWGYAEALHLKASVEIASGNYNKAYDSIQEMIKIAPLSAEALGEEGFILIKLKRFEEALLAYQKSYDLSLKYKTQKLYTAGALRGKGVALIDLNRLNEAEIAFNQSLEIEPNNEIAIGELNYIESIRTQNKNSK